MQDSNTISVSMKAILVNSKGHRNTKDHFVCIAVPVACDNLADFRLISLAERLAMREDAFVFYKPTKFAAQGRDAIVGEILQNIPTVTDFLFLDADSIPDDKVIDEMLGFDISVGVCPIVQKGHIKWNVMPKNGELKHRLERFEGIPFLELPKEPFLLNTYGFGCVMVRRKVFEKMEWPYFKDIFVPGRRAIGQDTYFANKSAEAGFESWCVPEVQCEHNKAVPLLEIAKTIYKEQ